MLANVWTTLNLMKNPLTDRRNKGERRWGLAVEFPLRDSSGVVVVSERRKLCDRRLDNTTLLDRLLMFSGAVPVDKGKNRH